jgi:RecJ-like exonuclease
MSIEVKLPSFHDLCPICLGSGKIKAMQRAKISNSKETVRAKDVELKCSYCKGSGKNNL